MAAGQARPQRSGDLPTAPETPEIDATEAPPALLARTVAFRSRGAGGGRMTFDGGGSAVEIDLDANRLHMICELLAELVRKADWKLDLELPWQRELARPDPQRMM